MSSSGETLSRPGAHQLRRGPGWGLPDVQVSALQKLGRGVTVHTAFVPGLVSEGPLCLQPGVSARLTGLDGSR